MTDTIQNQAHVERNDRNGRFVRHPLSNIVQRPLRVALVGCGAIAEQMHLPVLAGHDVLKLTTLVDRDAVRANKFAAGYGVERVLDDAAKLMPDDIDAAIIASPAFHHATCAIDLLQKRIHVLVEKPMATSLADAERMVAAAEKSGATLSVGYFRRLYPSMQLLKSLLDSGWAGPPQRFLIEGGGMYSWGAATLGSMRRDLAGGGALIDFGSHMIDLMFALFDGPAEVLEYRDNALGGIESDGTAEVRIRHNGMPIEGRIEIARTRNIGNFIRVECEHATLEFQVNERFRVKVIPRGTELVDPITREPREFWFDAVWRDSASDESWYATFGRQYTDWVQAIETGQEPVLSGRSALATSRLIENCYENRKPMAEPWVWRGIYDSGEPSTNGRPKPPGVHLAGRSRLILVTGASGFIGSRVAEVLALRDGWKVRALVHNPGNASRLARLPIEMLQGDLQDGEKIRRMIDGCDAVVHCAMGTAWGRRKEIFAVTAAGTRRLADAALASGVKRFVHLSTISIYGDDSKMTGMIDESTPVRPTRGSDYGESKAAAERAVFAAAKRGLPAVILRPARVYGPHARIYIQRPIQAIAERRFRWIGSPGVPADMVYVDNVVEAIVCSLAAPTSVCGEVFTVGEGNPITWETFYKYFAERLGVTFDAPIINQDCLKQGTVGRWWNPLAWLAGTKRLVISSEFKSLGRRILETPPLGSLPRWTLETFPSAERFVRRMVGADDTLAIYQRAEPVPDDWVEMGSGGALVNITKARRLLKYEPKVTMDQGLNMTLDWIKHARIIG